jgi:hypothetical protein
VWSLKQGQRRWFHLIVLGLATAFWWLGESMAIRLGKYHYQPFPFPLRLPGGGSPDHPDLLAVLLQGLIPKDDPGFPGCVQRSWDIPFPVVALEAALMFSFLRISVLRLKVTGLPAALATAGMSALLMMNVTAVLDPVVSTTSWCDPTTSDPQFHGLNFGLWHWLTNHRHQGYWFGVPLVNYVAWFLAVATFSLILRLDDDGPRGLIRRYRHWFGYLGVILVLVVIFALLIPLKLVVDRIFVHGQDYLFAPHPIFDPKVWQIGVLALLLLSAVWLLKRHGSPRPHSGFDWVSALPQLFVFTFCLGALVVQPHWRIFAVWLTTTVIALVVIFWPFVSRIIAALRKRWLAPPGKIRVDV